MKKLFSLITSFALLFSIFSHRAIALTWTIDYSPSSATNTDVVATITGFDEPGTVILNNGGSPSYTFSSNTTFDFELSGDITTGTATATVTRIDKDAPQVTNITESQYFNTNITPNIIDPNFSGATLNGLEYTGTEITEEWVYTLFIEDTLGNNNSIHFTIDKTSPTAIIEYSTTGQTNQDVVAIITGFSETINTINTTGYMFTWNGSFTFFYTDLAGNLGSDIAEVTRIDKTTPTALPTNTNVIAILTGFSETLTGINETTYTFNSDGIFTFTYQDEVGNTGETIANVNWIDKESPTFDGIITGWSYGNTQIITFSDNKPGVTATLNGVWYTSGSPINGYWIFEFILTDTAGNTTWAIFQLDTTTPNITLNESSPIYLEVFSPYVEAGANWSDNGIWWAVTDIIGSINTNIIWVYTIDYVYNDGFHTGTAQREIIVQDTTVPIVTLNGDNPATIERTFSYIESGAIWTDNYDGSGIVTIISGTVDINTPGTYTLTYEKTDSSSNIGTTTRTINVIDTIAPTANILYSKTGVTNNDVIATITWFSESVTNINTTTHLFTGNDSFLFTYQDLEANTGASLANVTWIDKTLPTATLRYDPMGPSWTNGSVFVQITWFSENITGLNQPDYLFITNGTFIFTYRDIAGNTWTKTANVNRIDLTPPTVGQAYISVGNTGNNWATSYYNWIINIRANVSDAGGSSLDGSTCEYTLDNWITRNPAGFNSTYCEITNLSPATGIQLAFKIKDTATNLTTGTSRTYIYDTTAPTTTATPNSWTSNITIPVTLSRTDTGIWLFSWTRYCIDTTDTCTPNIAETTATITGAANTLETKYLRYRSIDRLNNSETIKSNVYTIDKILPWITGAISYSNNSTNTGYAKTNDIITIWFSSTRTLVTLPTVTISWGSLTTATVTDLGGNNYTASYTTKATDIQGQMKFIVTLQDTIWNTGTAIIDSVILDRTAPAGITFTSPTAGTFRTSGMNYDIRRSTGSETNFWPTSIKILYSVNSFLGYSVLENGTGNSGIYTRNNFNIDTDNLQIRIIATDLAGNQTTITSSTFGIDNIPPVAPTFINPIGWEFIKGGSGYLVSWTGGYDPNGNMASITLEYSINNGTTYTVISTTIPTNSTSYLRTPSTTLNSSTAKLRITYKDYAGLQAIKQTPTVFTLDWIRPNVTNILSGRIYTGTVTPIIIETNYSGSSVTTNSWSTTYTTTGFSLSQDGRYTLFVEDKAGNSSGYTFAIDTIAPTLQVYTGTLYQNTGFTMIATGYDATAGISWYQWTKLSGTGTITFSSSTGNQTNITASTWWIYTIQVKVIDKANYSWLATFTVIRNTDAPTLTSWTITTGNNIATFSFFSNKTGTLLYSGNCGTWTATTATNSWATITSWTLTNNTYNNCNIKVTDGFGNYSWISIPNFTINYTAPVAWWGGGWGWGGWWSTPTPICQSTDLLCENNIYTKKIGVSCQWWDFWKVCLSPIIYISGENKQQTELEQAYTYAKDLWIINNVSYQQTNILWMVTRGQLAKMISEFSTKVLKKKIDTTKKCDFKDIENQTEESKKYIKTACQLGIMGIDANWIPLENFYPEKIITRAVFGTTLSRILRWKKNDTTNKTRYQKHLQELQKRWIMKDIKKPENRELKWYVILMLMRTDKEFISSNFIKETIFSSGTIEETWGIQTIQTSEPKETSTPIITNNNSELTTTIQTLPTNSITRTESEQSFIQKINKTYQFTVGFKKNATDVSIKYLQYFLKSQGFYQGIINGTNTESTITALFEWQKANNILTDATDPAAGYLGPKTREVINPLLKTLLNS